MKTPSHDMRELSVERVDEIAASWEVSAGGDEFAIELSPFFAWCRDHTFPIDGDGQAFEVVNVESGDAEAILEIVDSKWGSTTKLLKLVINPLFWDMETDEKVDRIIRVYAAAIVGVLQNGMRKKYASVKIYGRNDSLLDILKKLQQNWPEDQIGAKASMEGRWLHVALNKEKK